MRYRLETVVEYSNSEEYRRCSRELFGMDPKVYEKNIAALENHNQEELDQETRDELAYDEAAVNKTVDYVLDCTKGVAEFEEVYKMAARRMMSEDPEIGIAILFSYDYMQRFHQCLVEFFQGRWSKDSESYRELTKQLS